MDGNAKSMVHRKRSKRVLSSSKAKIIPKCSIRTESKPDESRSRREFIEKSYNGSETKTANLWKINQRLRCRKKMSNNGMVKRNEKRSDCRSETTPTLRRIQDILH